MNTCQNFQEWLESSMKLSLSQIPAELQKHVTECHQCAEELQMLHDLRQSALADLPPAADIEKLWNRIYKTIWSDKSDKKSAARATQTTGGFWQKLLDFWPAKQIPAFLGVFAVAAILLYWVMAPNALPTAAGNIIGGSGNLLSAGLTLPLKASPRPCNSQDQIVLADSQAWAEISFNSGRTVSIEGSGQLQLSENGFKTDHGQFKASFGKGIEPLNVTVPGAVLGIRGTAIQFDLQNGEGTLKLLEGVVEVQPADGRQPFSWKPETSLQISSGKLLPQTDSKPGAGQATASQSLRHRPAEY